MRLIRSVTVVSILMLIAFAPAGAFGQDTAAQDHAKKVLDSLRQAKFEDVTAEFDAPMTATVTGQQLEQLWTSVKNQVGEFKSVIDQRTQDAQGMKMVVSGCQFDGAVVEIMVAFDSANKIAGLQLRPRAAPAPAASPAPATPPTPTTR